MGKGFKFPWVVLLTVISIFAALYIGFKGLEVSAMEIWYRRLTFYFLLLATGLWFQKILPEKISIEKLKAQLKRHLPALLIALVIVSAGTMACTPDYRILADEINLLGMSMGMYDEHQTYNPIQVLYYFHGMKRTIERQIDMRPGFFPFLVSLVHSASGYRPSNGFVVNFFAAFLILIVSYLLVNRWFGRFWGISMMLFIAAFPLFILYYNSCGFETVNLLFILLCVLLLDTYFRNPDASNAEKVFLILPLLAQTRYESALSVFAVIPLVLFKLPLKEFYNFSFRLVLIPLLFIPAAWLRIVTFSSRAFQVDSVEKAFGFDLFVKNLKKAIPFFFGKAREYGMVTIFAYLALAGLCWLLWDIFSRRDGGENRPYALGASILGLTLLHAFARFYYFWGNMTLQYTSRLGLVFVPLLAFLALYFLRKIVRAGLVAKNWIPVAAILLALHGWPVAGQNLAVRDIFFFREFKSVSEFLERNYPDKKNYILVTDLSNLYVPFRYSSVNCHFINTNKEDFLGQLRRKTYEKAIIVQKFRLTDDNATLNNSIDESFKMKKVYETQMHSGEYLRISELRIEDQPEK